MNEDIKTALIENSVFLVSKEASTTAPFIYQLALNKAVISMFIIQNDFYRLPFPMALGTVINLSDSELQLNSDFITPWPLIIHYDLTLFYTLPAIRYYEVIQEHYFIVDFESLLKNSA